MAGWFWFAMVAEVHYIYIFFIYLFGVLRRFQHCTGHITTGSWKGRGNQYIQFVRVLYCKLPTNGKQLPAFPLQAVTGIETRPQRWEARVLPLCHRGPPHYIYKKLISSQQPVFSHDNHTTIFLQNQTEANNLYFYRNISQAITDTHMQRI